MEKPDIDRPAVHISFPFFAALFVASFFGAPFAAVSVVFLFAAGFMLFLFLLGFRQILFKKAAACHCTMTPPERTGTFYRKSFSPSCRLFSGKDPRVGNVNF